MKNFYVFFSRLYSQLHAYLFLKIYFLYCLPLFLGLGILSWLLSSHLQSLRTQAEELILKERRVVVKTLAKQVIESPTTRYRKGLQEFAKKTNTEIRVYDHKENLIFQSLSLSLENNKARQVTSGELKENIEPNYFPTESTYVLRSKDLVLGQVTIKRYLSHPFLKKPGIIQLDSYLWISILIFLVIGYYLSRRVTVPIREMVQVCNAILNENYNQHIKVTRNDELGRLAKTINILSKKINRKIATISVERLQLESMLSSMVEGIISVDEKNKILFCNANSCKLLNCSAKDLVNAHIDRLPFFDELSNIIKESKRNQSCLKGEIILSGKVHDYIVDYSATPFDRNKKIGVVLVMHDVTEIKRLEKVRRDFVANVSHELKTPLTSIKGYTETLLSGAVSDPSHNIRFLNKIMNNSERLSCLVHDILSLAKIESEQCDIHYEMIKYRDVLGRVLASRENLIQKKRLIVQQDIEAAIEVWGEQEYLLQIVDNLLSNAIRYTLSEGSISIRTYQEGKYGVLEVADTGGGNPTKKNQSYF